MRKLTGKLMGKPEPRAMRWDPRVARDAPLRGIATMLIGIALLTLNDALMKWLVATIPVGEAIFLRGLFALIPIVLLLRLAGGLSALRLRNWRSQLLSACLLAGALFSFITALKLLPLGIAIIIVYTNPLFVTALAPLILKERVGWRRGGAVVIGFVGAALVIRPEGGEMSWALLLPLAASFLSALRDLVNRRLVYGETSVSILVLSLGLVMLLALTTAPFGWVMPDATSWFFLFCAGSAFAFAMFGMIDAFRYADASLVTPFKYIAVVLGLALGYIVWDELPDNLDFLGAAIIVASGLFILKREAELKEQPVQSPELPR